MNREALPHLLFDLRWIRSVRLDGIGRYTRELFRHLVAARPRFAITGLYGNDAVRDAHLGDLDGPARLVPAEAGLFSPKNYAYLGKMLRRRSCRWYLTTNYLGFPPRRSAGTIRVAFVHDLIPWEIDAARRGNPRWALFYRCPPAGRFLLRRAPDHLVAVSERTRRAVVSRFGVDEKRISVIHGAPSNSFTPQPDGDDEVLRRLRVRPPYLLFVGRADRYKNIERLVAAHRRLDANLRRRYPLLLVGPNAETAGGDDAIRVASIAEEKDLAALYRSATLLVLPSLLEGFGLPLVEAFACGTPALASRVEPLTEIGSDGARYFDPEDVESMAQTMAEVLADEEGLVELGRRAARRAKMYSWEKSARAMIDLLEQLDGERG